LTGCEFDSQPFNRYHVTTWSKLPLSPSSIIWYWPKGGEAVWLEK